MRYINLRFTYFSLTRENVNIGQK